MSRQNIPKDYDQKLVKSDVWVHVYHKMLMIIILKATRGDSKPIKCFIILAVICESM